MDKYTPKKDYSNSLIAKWVFDDTDKNSVDGNVIKDLSGHGYDGTMNNIKFVEDPNLGKCAYFNGSNSYIQFNDRIVPLGKKSIKVNVKKITEKNIYLITNSFNGGSEYGCAFQCSNNTMRTVLGNASNSTVLDLTAPNNSCNNTNGNTLLYTWDGTLNNDAVKMYSENLAKPIVTGTSKFEETQLQTRNLYIGKIDNWGTFEGYVKSIEIYNDVLEFEGEEKLLTIIINLTDGETKVFDVSADEVRKFKSWYNTKTEYEAKPTYEFDKTVNLNISVEENVVHDQITSYEIRKY